MNRTMGSLLFATLMASPYAAQAQSPDQIRFGGSLRRSGGPPLNVQVGIEVAIYDGPGEDAQVLWSDRHEVEVVDGRFNIDLALEREVFVSDGERWLGVTVGNDPEMQPRFRFSSVPYAVRASWADNALSDEEIRLMLQDDPRFLSVASACGDGETVAFSTVAGGWSCTAVVGEEGPQGPVGPQGEEGPVGPRGDRGPAGPRGDPGPQGEVGAQGPIGPIGPAGHDVVLSSVAVGNVNCPDGGVEVVGKGGTQYVCNGPQGASGQDGAQGPVGPTGATGDQGPAGVSVTSQDLAVGDANCPDGGVALTSVSGTTYVCNGSDGATGPQGPTGATGPQGPIGPTGAQGSAGADGESVTAISLAVGDPNCPDGGVELSSVSGTDYICNGADGAAGAVGPQGPAGAGGADGSDGTSVTAVSLAPGDPNCPDGGAAFSSASGTSYVCNGATGPAGATGAQGPAGTDGADGTSVTVTALSSGDPNCAEGGARFVGASGTAYACNGADGASGGGSTGSGSAGDLVVASGVTIDVVNNGWSALSSGLNFNFEDIDIDGTLIIPSGTVLKATGTVDISGTLQVGTGATEGGQGQSIRAAGYGNYPGKAYPEVTLANILRPGVAAGGAGAGSGGGAGGGAITIVSAGTLSVSGTIQANGADGSNPNTAGQGVPGPGGGGGGFIILASDASVTVTGTLRADGGDGGTGWNGNGGDVEGGGGGGGGGVIHLMSPTAPSTGSATLSVAGGAAGSDGTGSGNPGGGNAGGASGGDGGNGAYSQWNGSWSYPRAGGGSSGQTITNTFSTPSDAL